MASSQVTSRDVTRDMLWIVANRVILLYLGCLKDILHDILSLDYPDFRLISHVNDFINLGNQTGVLHKENVGFVAMKNDEISGNKTMLHILTPFYTLINTSTAFQEHKQ